MNYSVYTKKLQRVVGGTLFLLVFGGFGIFFISTSQHNKLAGKLDGFAQCLKDKGVLFYGAFWCPHCQNQKAMFGSSAQFLPYVECSTPDGKGREAICDQNQIKGYPTWVFPDGSRKSGEVPLSDLAAASGCQLPKIAP